MSAPHQRWSSQIAIASTALITLLGLWACDEPDADGAEDRPPPEHVECDCPPIEELATGLPDFAEHVNTVRPAVVNIYTRTDPPESSIRPSDPPAIVPQDRVRESLGSGFIFDDSGLILTNDHVINGASEIAVRLLDERVFSATVVGSDPPTDIAVLQLDFHNDNDEDQDESEDNEPPIPDDLPSVTFGDSDELLVGHWVLAIGNPLGLASTVTAGIASATGRQVMPPGGQLRFQDFIQTDASINPGSSGGPLVNVNSEVVGIATAMTPDSQGLGFAIPINMVTDILDDLIEHGRVERSWLGVYVAEVTDPLREEFDIDEPGGALITRLVDGGPADGAGIEPGDIVVTIDGNAVEDAHHLAWLAATIGVDRTVDVELYRNEERQTLPLTMGSMPEQ